MVEGTRVGPAPAGSGAAPGEQWAAWLLARRAAIEAGLARAAGPADPAAPETEALRRFRAYVVGALRRPHAPPSPSLDGLRVDAARARARIAAWCAAATAEAGAASPDLRARLAPLAARFDQALRTQGAARRARAPAAQRRRAVMAAIDRVADAYLAVDVDSGEVVDANPAAAALVGAGRGGILGGRALDWVAPDAREAWTSHLEALAESAEPRRFACVLRDAAGAPVPVEVSATRYTQRSRTLALLVARAASG